MYTPHVWRALSILVSFASLALLALLFGHHIPGLALILAIVVGCATVWSLANIACLICMVVRHDAKLH